MDFSGTYVATGNSKLGRKVGTINRQAGMTCPGASEWCATACYAKHGRYKQFGLQLKYGERTIELPDKLPPMVRIHASGDFDTVDYIEWWLGIAIAHPDTHFWAYTRSWMVPALMPALEKLQALSNVQLFASMDASMEDTPPSGWRVAFMAMDTRFTGPQCMEQTGAKASCQDCKYCFVGHRGNIKFASH